MAISLSLSDVWGRYAKICLPQTEYYLQEHISRQSCYEISICQPQSKIESQKLKQIALIKRVQNEVVKSE